MTRLPVVADRFYPGDPTRLKQTLDDLIGPVQDTRKRKAKAVIAPHAGYVYSGGVAGETFARVEIPETVIILGPNHHGHGEPVALGTEDWAMPMGKVAFAVDLAAAILKDSEVIVADNLAHKYEHSLEVQVPFLQYFQNKLAIVPIVVSHISLNQCRQAALEIVRAIKDCDRDVLMVASTDMTHYESRHNASIKDQLALKHIQNLDPQGLYNTVVTNRISMCGVIPTTIVLLAAMELGAVKAELVRYTDSGEASGDTSQVVGYAGLVIS
ncbi:MAG: AmmeMemoRadiSam system protein B [Deltaproteobacteria bacterium]|nr:AmmeMemoRadiSam system protein B [Deltaproteobacteria bacterium]